MTVYITNEQQRFDFRPAQHYGELKFVTSRVYSFNSPIVNDAIMASVSEMADRFDPSVDYVLPAGSAISTGLVFAALALRNHTRVPVLVWSGNDSCYISGTINITPIIQKDE